MRAFLALPLPDQVCATLEDLQLSLPFGKLVPSENLHLTLAFLDEQPVAQLEEVHAVLSLLKSPGFSLSLVGLGCFAGKGPVSLHAEAIHATELMELHRKVRAALRGAGLILPRSRFLPHVTLARFRRGMRSEDQARLAGFLAANAGFHAGPFDVLEFTLFSSTLDQGGARHEALATYPLC
ncbi:MAG: RNA 2',3'-cyclic phosphodiesterase [Albidovulum sp.]